MLVFAGLLAAAIYSQITAVLIGMWPVFLALAAVSWLTIDRWAALEKPSAVRLLHFGAFIFIQMGAALPFVAVAWEVAPRLVLGASVASLASFAGLFVFALRKPTTYLEPVDPFIVAGITTFVNLVAMLALGLRFDLVVVAPLIALTGIMVLSTICNVVNYVGEGEHVGGGLHLFAAAAVLFNEFMVVFISHGGAAEMLREFLVLHLDVWLAVLGVS